MELYSVAIMYLQTAWFTGKAKTCVLENVFSQIIIGSTTQVKDLSSEQIESQQKVQDILANAVTTCSESIRREKYLQSEKAEQVVNVQWVIEGDLIEEEDMHNESKNENKGGMIEITTQNFPVGSKKLSFQEDQQRDMTLQQCFTRARNGNFQYTKNGW